MMYYILSTDWAPSRHSRLSNPDIPVLAGPVIGVHKYAAAFTEAARADAYRQFHHAATAEVIELPHQQLAEIASEYKAQHPRWTIDPGPEDQPGQALDADALIARCASHEE